MSGCNRLLKRLAEKLWQDFTLRVVVATEIEFYLHDIGSKVAPEQAIAKIQDACNAAGLTVASAEAERGPDQFEVAFLPSDNVAQMVADTDCFKALMSETFGAAADFSAKPLSDKPGSGLHVHVHLEDEQGHNVFFRGENEAFSPLLLYAIGGLLEFMNPSMVFFAPTEASYSRITAVTPLQGMQRSKGDYNNCPTTVSWGTNNRSCAIRLPTKPMLNKHLEQRVAGSDADMGKVVAAILAGVHYGITEKCNPGQPIYGDASLAQYALPALAKTLDEAKRYAAEFTPLKEYLL